MAVINRRARLRLLLRSFLIQGSWNYRTMQGSGLGFALIPALKRLYRADEELRDGAIGRHSGFFNGHPYLSTVAISALARMEEEGATSEQQERFKHALVSPLGSLGDRLFWARWRPLCSLAAVLVFLAGAPWWVSVGLFLISYNVVQVAIRVWGLRLGWREGHKVGQALMGSRLRRLPDRLTIPLAIASGAVLPPVVFDLAGSFDAGAVLVVGAALALAAAGYARPVPSQRAADLGLLLAALLFIVLETVAW